MIYGFTGTRFGMTDYQKAMLEGLLTDCIEFHHGSCAGADVEAARIVRKMFVKHIKIIAHPPIITDWLELSGVDDETMAPTGYLTRNRKIVDACEELIACPQDMKESSGGTWYTIRYARSAGVKRTIISPIGGLFD